jgi:hypothetical protein
MSTVNSNCESQLGPADDPKVVGLVQYMEAMGIETCKTSGSLDQAAGSLHGEAGSVPGLFTAASATIEFSTTKSTFDTVGCEQIAAQSNIYNNTVNNVKCQLNSITSKASATAISTQDIQFGGPECGNDQLVLNCTHLRANQDSTLTINAISSLNNEDATQIASSVQQGLTQIAEMDQSSKNGFGATPQGQKLLNEIKATLNTNDTQNSIKKNAGDAVASMFGSQNKLICGKITSYNCDFNQDIVMNIIAKSIVENAFTSSFSSDYVSQARQQASGSQAAENAGAPTVKPTDWSKSSMSIIMAIVCVVALIIVAFIIVKMMNNQQIQQETIDQHSEDINGGRGRYKIKNNKYRYRY